ncbi:bifunctional folylpolyglutamate synthase/dihydrofolate synthase [Alteraurantiacibacter aquimixticola]|uniref:Dihydrofolate synthase/folylpolyglutamate synthase n=1 Tax=Alteraurantiacibacter aquimixticola TaxID=2489173 RepID=A0A4T3F2L7_9SPHN|nr:folylpolyglutamate synthase/dihydrofolate synthase family protein [Alteraurantiacibacter aquimixticola]TIX50330.1 bifunctional folylpolyglutamate synthase/dihydrofolate synthase [Alteraurantiacibacter aquimixticola]
MKDFASSGDPEVQAQLDRLSALSLPQGRIGLEVIHEILDRLGNPERDLPPVFHVAGTNGKGSTCAYLRAMLEAEGLTVHVATKPHLVRYNERIRVAGKLISDNMLAALLKEVLDISEDLGPSFFEVTTAATLLAFSRVPADACVIEVGLGGRFDATNVMVQPAACGISSLGVDHHQFLLNEDPTAPSPDNPEVRIAFEKVGIVRAGSPMVTQNYREDMEAMIAQRCADEGAPLFMRGKAWDAEVSDDGIAYRDEHGTLSLPLPQMPGSHQGDNAALAVAMLRHQDVVSVSPEAMAEGISSAIWPARLQVLADGPLTRLLPEAMVLLDGGHNPDAALAMAKFLDSKADKPVDAIMGMLSAKDARTTLEIIAPHLSSFTAIPIEGSEYHPLEDLAAMARNAGVGEVHMADSLEEALQGLASRHKKGGTVLIAGSLYLAGNVLKANGEVPD